MGRGIMEDYSYLWFEKKKTTHKQQNETKTIWPITNAPIGGQDLFHHVHLWAQWRMASFQPGVYILPISLRVYFFVNDKWNFLNVIPGDFYCNILEILPFVWIRMTDIRYLPLLVLLEGLYNFSRWVTEIGGLLYLVTSTIVWKVNFCNNNVSPGSIHCRFHIRVTRVGGGWVETYWQEIAKIMCGVLMAFMGSETEHKWHMHSYKRFSGNSLIGVYVSDKFNLWRVWLALLLLMGSVTAWAHFDHYRLFHVFIKDVM